MYSPATPSVRVDPGSLAPTPPDDDVSFEPRNTHINYSLGTASATATAHQTLLLTPTSSETQQNLDYISFTSLSSRRTTFRHTQNTSTSEHLSMPNCQSPTFSSNRSINSSEHDRSIGSYSSSDYLTPPRFQPDFDNPPYIPRQGDRNSLTMMGIRRAQTIPAADKQLFKSERRRKRRYRSKKIKASKYRDHSYWSEPRCQTTSTTPSGQQHLCTGPTKYLTAVNTSYEDTNVDGRYHLLSSSVQTLQTKFRRWSSVEVRTHQVPLASSLSLGAPQQNTENSTLIKNFLPPIGRGWHFRSPSFTRGTTEHDIIQTVRQRLRLREMEHLPLETPASITLRRPSEKSFLGDFTTSPASNQETIGDYLEARRKRSISATYLITTKDIESITDLIAAKIEAKYIKEKKRTSTASRKHKLTRSKSYLDDLAAAVKDEKTPQTRDYSLEYLQVSSSNQKTRNGPQRVYSKKNDEVIWQGSVSPYSEGSFVEGDSIVAPQLFASKSETPGHQVSISLPIFAQEELNTAFDPKDVRSSISKWQKDISLVVTSSDDDSVIKKGQLAAHDGMESPKLLPGPTSRERQRPRPFLRYRSSANTVQDVESFPALPQRKMTSDWHSPLPEMETYSPLTTPRPPYNQGLTSKEVTPKASQISLVTLAQVSPGPSSPSMNMDFTSGISTHLGSFELQPVRDATIRHTTNPPEEIHRKSVVKLHPNAPARTGSPTSIGSSIGISHHERIRCDRPRPPVYSKTEILPPSAATPAAVQRGASLPQINRVRTIDNAQKGEQRDGLARWRPPSICPPPRTPSASDHDDAPDNGQQETKISDILIPATRLSHLERIRRVFQQGMSLTRDISPPSVKVDHVGIHGQITGVWLNTSARDKDVRQDTEIEDFDECDDVMNHPNRDRNAYVD